MPRGRPATPRRPAPFAGRAIALGSGAGVLSGLFGVGGGVVLVPGMVMWLGVTQHAAHATSLAAIIPTAAAAAASYARSGAVHAPAALVVIVGAFAGALVGAAAMHRLPAARLHGVFVGLLVIVGGRLLLAPALTDTLVCCDLVVARVAGWVALGIVSGAASALLGVGGGLVIVPALVLLFGFDQHTAEGTSLLVIVPTAITGAVRHARHGYTDWRCGALLGVGGVAGGVAGSVAALSLDTVALQRFFAAFVVVTAVLLLRRRSG